MAETKQSLFDYAVPPPVARANAPVNRAQPKSPLDYMSELDLMALLDSTGIPERAALANELLNPLAAIPRAQAASRDIFEPDRSIAQRIGSTGNMLTELAGIAVPMAASARAGAPAAAAVMEGLLGGSPTTQAASDAARGFLADESGSLPLPFSTAGQATGKLDELTGLPLNTDGTVTLYHGTTKQNAQAITKDSRLRSAGEPDVYLTTDKTGGGYGDGTVVAVDVDPKTIKLDDAFPNGRLDFRLPVGRKLVSSPLKVTLIPFRADDPAQARGAQIIDMLQSGRAGEITDEMLDMGDPVANARLNEYLFKNYDLPMDEASRMARAGEMGFDTKAYHGTPKDYPAIKKDVTFYTTPSPEYASMYGNASASPMGGKDAEHFFNQKPNVIPIMSKTKNLLDTNTKEGRSVFNKNFFMKYGNATPLTERGYPDWVEGEDFRDMFNDNGMSYNAVSLDEGKIPIDLHAGDFFDRGISNAHFDPTNIRSRFARFDPRLAHLRNLSAGVAGGVPLGLMSMTTDEERR